MSPIVNSFQNFFTPDVQLREADPAASLRGGGIGVVGVLVQATRGPVGVPTIVSSLSDYIRKFGDYDSTLREDFMFMYNLFNQGTDDVLVVRCTDGNEAKATVTQTGTTFRAFTPGTWGNSISLTVAASAATGYVDLTFAYGAKEIYKYAQVTFTNAADSRYYQTVIEASGDNFIEIATPGSTNLTPGTYTFTGGTNGTVSGISMLDTGYVGTNGANGLTGLVAFESNEDVEILVCARANNTINSALLTHVNLASVSPRMAVIAPASGAVVSTATALMTSYNTDRVVMTYPFMQVQNPYNNLKKEYHNPTAFYAGVLSKLSYHQSPSRQQVNGVIGTERALTKSEIDTLSQYRISPIQLKTGVGFVVMNGYNTSTNPSKSNITRRRAMNYFAKTFEAGSQQFVSKPHTPGLRTDVKSAFGAMLQQEANLGKIGNVGGGKPFGVKCDDQNNPVESVRAGKLIVDVQISLWAPADFILITLDASEAKTISIQ